MNTELLEVLNRYSIQDAGELTSGNIFFVDSGADGTLDDADGEHGKSWLYPFATIDFAVGQCTDSAGDIIYVAAGHAETLAAAAGIDLDIIGITIIGMGRGALRPTITLGTDAATVDIDVDAAEITVKNIIFKVAAVDVTVMIDVNADGFTLEDCEINMNVASFEAVTGVDINGGANGADRTTIRNCTFLATIAAGSSRGIELGEAEDRVIIEGCTVIGDFSDACIHNITGKLCTNLVIKDCLLKNDNAGEHAIELVEACTGMLVRNMYHTNAAATAVDPGSCYSFECYGIDAADESAFVRPAVGTP